MKMLASKQMLSKSWRSVSALRVQSEMLRPFSSLRTTLEKQVRSFPTKDILRFCEQDIRWNLQQFKQHTEAVAFGLLQLGFKDGTTLVSCLNADAENVGVALGGALAGINVAQVDGKIDSEAALKDILTTSKCRGLVISAADIPLLYRAIPQLESMPQILDSTLTIPEFPELKYIFQTGQATQRGTHRFRDVLAYYSSLDLPLSTDPSTTVLTVLDAKSGAVKESLTEEALLSKSEQAAGELALQADGRVLFAGKSVAPSLAIASLASALKLGKLVVPSVDYSTESVSTALSLEECTFAIGDSAPSGLTSWKP